MAFTVNSYKVRFLGPSNLGSAFIVTSAWGRNPNEAMHAAFAKLDTADRPCNEFTVDDVRVSPTGEFKVLGEVN
jgi:hypothetical protein